MEIKEAKLKIADICMSTAGAMPFDRLSFTADEKEALIEEIEELQAQCEFAAIEMGDVIKELS